MPKYRTEDGQQVEVGDKAYDYYSMFPGTIEKDAGDGWFEFRHTNGRVVLLNGQRICSTKLAVELGYPFLAI